MTSYRLTFYFFLTCLASFFSFFPLQASVSDFPVLYKGRFRPVDAYARLWLYEFYQAQALKNVDLEAFHQSTPSALDFLWQLHFKGHSSFEKAPLFWIPSANVKRLAQLDLLKNRFNYQEVTHALYLNADSSQPILYHLMTYHFLQNYLDSHNRSRSERRELTQLLSSLWVEFEGNDLVISAVPTSSPWPFLKRGQRIAIDVRHQAVEWIKQNKKVAEGLSTLLNDLQQFEKIDAFPSTQEWAYRQSFETLQTKQLSSKQIALQLEKDYPLLQRLKTAGSLFKALPSRHQAGEWFSLHALKIHVYNQQHNRLLPIGNFTLFSDEDFQHIRETYLAWEEALIRAKDFHSAQLLYEPFTLSLEKAFTRLAGQPYQEAAGKALFYPTLNQLKAESWYYHYPWIKFLIFLYCCSAFLLFFSYRFPTYSFFQKGAFAVLIGAFMCHSILLLWRCYILNRPPVSNMFETVIYVPWVAVLAALILNQWQRHSLLLMAAVFTSTILLILIDLTDLNHSLEQVQAVLDSQFWLIIHVLMIVGSYGIYILGAFLGHFYLGFFLYYRQETPVMKLLAQLILQTMYIGTVLLIPGTILGGVWAAESWGRFWDWDPKESWAFISSCLYLIWIHAYRFNRIAHFGLAFGSISGLLAISFTWYGVNYILGTGLHSYGFGEGGEGYYYTFLLGESLFLLYTLWVYRMTQKQLSTL